MLTAVPNSGTMLCPATFAARSKEVGAGIDRTLPSSGEMVGPEGTG
jgi:hypothetical protein